MLDTLKTITAAQWITIGVAFIAPVISLFGVIYTNHTTKKITKTNIDANITAKARIEWIQNVRKTTAELLTICRKVISSAENELENDFRQNLSEAQEKIALFVLYFGPDDGSGEEKALDLSDTKTNKGKNNLIVEFIEELRINIMKCYGKQLSYKESNNELKKCHSCAFDECCNFLPDKIICIKDEEGTPFTVDDCKEHQRNQNIIVSEFDEYKKDLFFSLRYLSDIMRIYCKIEWNRAKGGK